MNIWNWALVLIALGAVGFGEYRVHEAHKEAAATVKNKEAGWKKAAKQDAEWQGLETKEALENSQANYVTLMREFSDYQNEHVCKPK